MKILFLSHEVAPFAKVGGLADVAGSLPKALKELGHDVRILMPAYQMILDSGAYPIRTAVRELDVAINPIWSKRADLFETNLDDVPVYLLGTDEWFNETQNSQSVYLPGSNQHLFFSRAVLAVCRALDWIPHVVHCNDWHTGLIPVMLREETNPIWEGTASIFTIHNLAYQGEFPFEILDQAGLSHELYNMHQLETYGSVNFLKAGCVYADQVNTVSPSYAEEVQTPEFGCRLEGLMKHLAEQGRLHGILNGVDQDVFDPATDPALPFHYSADRTENKAKVKEALLQELQMEPIPGAPLMGVVSRLSSQKGMDLMLQVMDRMTMLPTQLIVQGLGDPWLAERFRAMSERFPNHLRFVERFDAALANRVYAGCDIFLMPSAFEPCGLGQLIAMRYGTVPVVRSTGGLADTVFDGQNGFAFQERDAEAFLATVRRAAFAYSNASAWSELMQRAMRHDSRWESSAIQYESVYEQAVRSRQAVAKSA